MFTKGNTYSTGRPKGALNKAPKREQLCDLLNSILSDFINDYETLTKEDKIQILRTFRHLYKFENSSEVIDQEITIKIIEPNV
jgi:hypothetical protein